MNLGYHTAGLLLHDEATAICELAKLGYRTVAIRPRRGSFNPLDTDFPRQSERIAQAVKQSGVELVIDANSHFIHDVRQFTEPSLVSHQPQQRQLAAAWIRRLIDVAAELAASSVVISSGAVNAGADTIAPDAKAKEPLTQPATDDDAAAPLDQLAEQLHPLLDHAQSSGVAILLCPTAKTLVSNVAGYERIRQWLDPRVKLGLAADIAEMLASGELPLSERLARNANSLGGVFLRDVSHAAAGDQRIGQGEVNLERILAALNHQGFLGWAMVCVQGHEKLGLAAAEEAIAKLGSHF